MGRGDRARGGMPPEPDLPPLSGTETTVVVEARARTIQIRARNYTQGAYTREVKEVVIDLDREAARLLNHALADAYEAHGQGRATEVTVVRGL